MKAFAYRRPASLAEALGALGPAARPLAGGTDLLTLMKAGLAAPERVVAVRTLLSSQVQAGEEGLSIGAATTLARIEKHERIVAEYSALAQAAGLAASAQIRNMATLGGNLLQRPRCWYFRHPEVHCWLKGGADCPAREGENRMHALFAGGPCVAVHPADPAAALLALDAAAHIAGPRGERRVPLGELFAEPAAGRRSETTLAEDELVVSLELPRAAGRSLYLKAMDRAAFAFALAGVAALLALDGSGRIAQARVVLSGVAPVPWRAHAAERVLVGAAPEAALFERAASAALEGAQPLAQNAFKVPLARALVRRALEALA